MKILNFLRRIKFYNKMKKKRCYISLKAKVNPNCFFEGDNKVEAYSQLSNTWVGKHTYIGHNSKFYKTKIGSYSSIAPNATLIAGRHPTNFLSTHPVFYSKSYRYSKLNCESNKFNEYHYTNKTNEYMVEIGNDVWIGENVSILDGITINDGAIVGANALVIKNVPPYAIVGGVPAKIIKYRFDKPVIDKLLKLKWWDKSADWLIQNKHDFNNVEKIIRGVEF